MFEVQDLDMCPVITMLFLVLNSEGTLRGMHRIKVRHPKKPVPVVNFLQILSCDVYRDLMNFILLGIFSCPMFPVLFTHE